MISVPVTDFFLSFFEVNVKVALSEGHAWVNTAWQWKLLE